MLIGGFKMVLNEIIKLFVILTLGEEICQGVKERNRKERINEIIEESKEKGRMIIC